MPTRFQFSHAASQAHCRAVPGAARSPGVPRSRSPAPTVWSGKALRKERSSNLHPARAAVAVTAAHARAPGNVPRFAPRGPELVLCPHAEAPLGPARGSQEKNPTDLPNKSHRKATLFSKAPNVRKAALMGHPHLAGSPLRLSVTWERGAPSLGRRFEHPRLGVLDIHDSALRTGKVHAGPQGSTAAPQPRRRLQRVELRFSGNLGARCSRVRTRGPLGTPERRSRDPSLLAPGGNPQPGKRLSPPVPEGARPVETLALPSLSRLPVSLPAARSPP